MTRLRYPSRRSFFDSLLLVSAAMFGFESPARAGGARSGPWCRELTGTARDEAYDFSLYLLDGDGTVFTLGDHVGRPVWLQFFASWCPPCNDEASEIVTLAGKYGASIYMAGIDVKERPEPVRAFRDRHKIPFPIALDSKGAVFKSLGFTVLPTHMFFDARGLVSCISVGTLTAEQMDNEIAVALARGPVPTASEGPVKMSR